VAIIAKRKGGGFMEHIKGHRKTEKKSKKSSKKAKK
jgi:hypothetical protein